MSDKKHRCSIGIIVDKSKATIQLPNAILAPSSYWLIVPREDFSKHSKPGRTEENILLASTGVLLVLAAIILFFTDDRSESFFIWIKICILPFSVAFLSAVSLVYKRRRKRSKHSYCRRL